MNIYLHFDLLNLIKIHFILPFEVIEKHLLIF